MNAPQELYPALDNYCAGVIQQFDRIPEARRILLNELAAYVFKGLVPGNKSSLTFICTHNSRRSQMAQLWAFAATAYYQIDGVHSFSGGTEATAFHRNAITALERAGFKIAMAQAGENPLYEASWRDSTAPVTMFSKTYNDSENPSMDFMAVMVCSDADQNCPYVPGATRLALPYDDPKAYDGMPGEAAMYDKCCRQIAVEMFYAMHRVRETMDANG